MKTIVHIELSDLDRNDLAKRIRRDPDTPLYATRNDIKEHILSFIQQEIEYGRNMLHEHTDDSDADAAHGSGRPTGDDTAATRKPPAAVNGQSFVPSRGDESYLTQPRDPDIQAACNRIRDDIETLERFVDDTIERNRKK